MRLQPTVPPAPPVQQARQVVDAPAVGPEQPPRRAELLGRRDQRVEEEMIAPQVGPSRNADAAPESPADAPPRPQPPDPTAAPGEARRGPDLARFLPDRFGPPPAGGQGQSSQPNAVERRVGPVTLLDTASSPFADYLIDRGHRALRLMTLNAELTAWYAGDVRGLRLPAGVRTAVDAGGDVFDSVVEQSSGSAKVDRLLLNALRGAAQGRPPPPEALRDGRATLVLVLEPDVLKIGLR